MILSQITRSDVRFELLLCTSDAENLSPVASVAQTVVSVSVASVAVVGPGTIAVVAVVGISLRLGSGGGLSISGPLAVVDAMMSVRVSSIGVSSVSSVAQTVVSQTIGSVVVGISIGLGSGGGLSISGPLAIVDAVVGIGVSGISIGPVASIGVRVAVDAVVGISLSLRLGLWLTGDEGGKANHKSELHCCLSVESRIPC